MSTGFVMDQNIPIYIVASCGIIQLALLLPKYYNRFLESLKNRTTLKAYAFSTVQFAICGFTYLGGANITTYSYAKYALDREKYLLNDPLSGRLPDRILDSFTVTEDSNLVMVADAMAFLWPVFATICCFLFYHTDLFNVMVFQVSMFLIGNAIAENLTTLPASIGWRRCKFRSYSHFKTINDWKFGTDGLGGCASMMWSGHTVHCIIPAYCFFSSLEREFGIVARLTKREFFGISVKIMLTILVGFAEGILILATHDHYSVDIWISFVLTALVIANPKIDYWAGRMNPYIKHLDKPKTFVEKALLNQKVLAELQTRIPSAFQVMDEDGVPSEIAKWTRSSEMFHRDEETKNKDIEVGGASPDLPEDVRI